MFLIIKRHAILIPISRSYPRVKRFNVGFTTSDVIYKNTPFCTNSRSFCIIKVVLFNSEFSFCINLIKMKNERKNLKFYKEKIKQD